MKHDSTLSPTTCDREPSINRIYAIQDAISTAGIYPLSRLRNSQPPGGPLKLGTEAINLAPKAGFLGEKL